MSQSESSQRIAADILIAAIQTAPSGEVAVLLKNPDRIAEQYKTIQEAVRQTKLPKGQTGS